MTTLQVLVLFLFFPLARGIRISAIGGRNQGRKLLAITTVLQHWSWCSGSII